MSVVTQFPPATSAEAIRWFSHKLHLETDCADVHSAQRAGEVDFVLLHVVGSPQAYAKCEDVLDAKLRAAGITPQQGSAQTVLERLKARQQTKAV
mgnify:CR=1 FL=1